MEIGRGLTIYSRHDEADLRCVGCASEMGINLFCLVLVQADESVQDVVAGRRVVVAALVIGEVVLHRRNGELLLESINLVQEQDYRGLGEPPGVADRVEQGERLLHAVDGLIFEEQLIVLGDRDQEEDGSDILETMDPLLTLRTLSTDVEHPVCELADDECGLCNTGGLNTRPQDILVVWHVVVLRDAGNIVEVAKDEVSIAIWIAGALGGPRNIVLKCFEELTILRNRSIGTPWNA